MEAEMSKIILVCVVRVVGGGVVFEKWDRILDVDFIVLVCIVFFKSGVSRGFLES